MMRNSFGAFTFLSLASVAWGRIEYLGIAIPGIDFGCDIDGSCPMDNAEFPLADMGGADGEAQMVHFVDNNEFNVFRLPTPWQYLVNNVLGGELNPQNFANYDKLMQACLGTGAYCMIDVHNFARWDDGIIGQGGPSDDDFVDLWRQLAKAYADNDKVIMGIMNEPHDLDIALWAETCQKVVTAIREAGAETHMILLPGTNFASAETFVSTRSAELLGAIENPDGSTDGLLLDIHKYLDINNSGTHSECTTDNVEGFRNLTGWLRENDRKAMVSESGASSDQTCFEKFCTQNEFIAMNTDVIIGFVGWGAGSFGPDYVLNLSPSGSPGNYQDHPLLTECIIGPFVDSGIEATHTPETSTTATSTSASRSTTATRTATTHAATTSTSRPVSPTEATDNSATPNDQQEEDDDSAASIRRVQFLSSGVALVAASLLYTGLRFF